MDITEPEYVGTATMDDLPGDVIGLIFQHIELYEDRKNARSVCRVWRDWINRDSSAEQYFIRNNDDENNFVEFKDLVPEFLGYQRERTTLNFVRVDLKETDDYWIEKGKQVFALCFFSCRTIPIEAILKYCTQLLELEVYFKDPVEQNHLTESMKQIVAKGITSLSVINLGILHCSVVKEELFNIVQPLDDIFPRLNLLVLSNFKSFKLEDLDTISQSLRNFKFPILLKNAKEDNDVSIVSLNAPPCVGAPVRVLRVNTDDYDDHKYHGDEEEFLNTLLKYEYKGLLSLRVQFDADIAVSFLKFQDFISNTPCLERLNIAARCIRHVGDNFFKNQLDQLILVNTSWPINPIQIGKNFVSSYQNLKHLDFGCVSFASFSKIINGLTALETFKVFDASPEKIEIGRNNKTLSSKSLNFLTMPRAFFIQTVTECIYNLPNLHKLYFSNHGETSSLIEGVCQKLNRNINRKDLKCLNCPKLESFVIDLVNPFNQYDHGGYIKWIKNILNAFPTIELFHFDHPDFKKVSLTISDEELSDLIRNNPKLKYISHFVDIEKRIDGLRSRMEL